MRFLQIILVLSTLVLGGCASIGERLALPGLVQGHPEAVLPPNPGYQVVSLHTSDGTPIVAEFGKALDSRGQPISAAEHAPTIVFFYGRLMCLAHSVTKDLFDKFRRTGANVIIPEFPGYGMSGGRATEREFYSTADAVYAYLLSREDIDRERIIAAGWSMGSGTAVDLASRKKVAGLIVVGAFTNLEDVGRPNLPWYVRWLTPALGARCKFDNLAKIHAVRCPIVLVYGSKDNLVPPEMADRLATASTSKVTRLEVEGAQHEDIWAVGGPVVWHAIENWMMSLNRIRTESSKAANERMPNQAPEPTPTTVTPPAGQEARQP